MLSKALDHLVSISTIILAACAIWVVSDCSGWVSRTDATPTPAPSTAPSRPRPAAPYEKGDQVAAVPGLDHSSSPHTLFIVVKFDCSFCTASMPFNKRIIERRTDRKASVRV